tara:strand:+ start:67 stop:528 length:462 start_codon:yes stop_codon:yes gene_type:complete
MEIINHPNYLIYEDGLVYSKKTDRFLKGKLSGNGYHQVLIDNKLCYIHRLLALQFIPNPENKPCIDHINNDRINNDLLNLRWVNPLENNQNRTINKNNTSGFQGVYKTKSNTFEVRWHVNRIRFTKSFKTIEEAVSYRKLMVEKYYVNRSYDR